MTGTTTIERVFDWFPDAKRNGKPNHFMTRCPAHDDTHPSLSVTVAEDGRLLLHCFAGCSHQNIVAAVGACEADLFPDSSSTPRKRSKRPVVSGCRVSGTTNAQRKLATFDSLAAAIADYERKYGTHAQRWEYHNTQGEIVSVVLRWNMPNGKKSMRPVSLIGHSWQQTNQSPRPLYDIHNLISTDRVYLTEGEKCAEIVKTLGLAATTWQGGVISVDKTDWSPLCGKEIVILPDNDEVGRKAATSIVGILDNMPGTRWRIVELPQLPHKGDIEQWNEQRQAEDATAEERGAMLTALADRAALNHAALPNNLAYKPFPVEALPDPVGRYVAETADGIGCDPAFVALPLIGAAGAAIGSSREIAMDAEWKQPPIFWTLIVGESGTSKSPALAKALRFTQHRHDEAMREFRQQADQAEVEDMRYAASIAEWKRNGCDGEPPTKPIVLTPDRCLVDDTTLEALCVTLEENPEGVLLANDELSGWFGSFDRYKGGGGVASSDAAYWLKMFDGAPVTVDRKGRDRRKGPIHVPRAYVSVVGGIQPAILERVISGQNTENGMAARFLYSFPPERLEEYTEPKASCEVQTMMTVFDRLFELAAKFDDGTPELVTLTDEAKAVLVQYINRSKREQLELTGGVRAAWVKLRNYALRFTLLIHCLRCAGDADRPLHELAADADSAKAAIHIVDWFGREARRIYATFNESADQRKVRRLAEYVARKGGELTIREAQKHNVGGCTTSAEVRELMQLAANSGAGAFDGHKFSCKVRPDTRQPDTFAAATA